MDSLACPLTNTLCPSLKKLNHAIKGVDLTNYLKNKKIIIKETEPLPSSLIFTNSLFFFGHLNVLYSANNYMSEAKFL